MRAIDVTSSTNIDSEVENNYKDHKFKVGDHVNIWKYKSFCKRTYSKLIRRSFTIRKVKNIEKKLFYEKKIKKNILKRFYGKKCKKLSKKSLGLKN